MKVQRMQKYSFFSFLWWNELLLLNCTEYVCITTMKSPYVLKHIYSTFIEYIIRIVYFI